MSRVIDRFLRYVAIDTQSLNDVGHVPSTQKQFDLARMLERELREMGASGVVLDEEHCYVYATLPATPGCESLPALGFVAHMDTSNDVSGENVTVQRIHNYDGGDIALGTSGLVLSPIDYPELGNYKGLDLLTTDGTTLLGADDKAGIAEIMEMAQLLLESGTPHPAIKIGFTPDEEVGAGVSFFDIERFGADFAYTVDGGPLGDINYENFNAAGGRVQIHGTSIHPGTAKGKMVNALLLGMEFQHLLPALEDPAATDGYEGFYHLTEMHGNCDFAELNYIIRDHDLETFSARKALFEKAGAFLNEKYKPGTVDVTVRDSYFNMNGIIAQHRHLIDNAEAVMHELDIVPIVSPIRGGTDGAGLSFMGLPCPNLCTGGHNYHGRYEYICEQSMERVVELLVRLAQRYSDAAAVL